MRLNNVNSLAIAGALLVAMASTANAECTIAGGGRAGVLQNNDLLSFGHPLPKGDFNAVYTDAAWAGNELTVEPKNGCRVLYYRANNGGHAWADAQATLPASTLGIGCSCAK